MGVAPDSSVIFFIYAVPQLGTILLVALPLGAVLCFFDLLGARALARGEVRITLLFSVLVSNIPAQCFLSCGHLQVALQSTFHGPLAYPLEGHRYPIFTHLRVLTPEEVEAGLGSRHERSFYRNSFSMVSTPTIVQLCGADTCEVRPLITVSQFTDPTSYQALFYFLVIKPGITILLSLLLIVLVPVAFALIVPVPAMLRLVRRLGIWQANVAVEGLFLGGG